MAAPQAKPTPAPQTQQENDNLNMQTMDAKGMKPAPTGAPKSTDRTPQDIMNQAAQMVQHVTQGHEGDPENCAHCGFGMDSTVFK